MHFLLVNDGTLVHNAHMVRRTNRQIIDDWIDQNSPGGLAKLASESGVSDSLISKIRATGEAPKTPRKRKRLAVFLNVAEDELFPFVRGKRSA
jgi:transcriptional regulator with XRE-family HTH domain